MDLASNDMTKSSGKLAAPLADQSAAPSIDLQRESRNHFEAHRLQISQRCDRMFAALFLVQWLAGIIVASILSPYTWAGNGRSLHPHVWAAIFLGAAIISFPIYLIITQSGSKLTRHAVAAAQMLTSALLIHVSGGRIETHFHIFGSLAFLAFYRDWRVLITASVVVALDHAARGIFWPTSVFGVASASNWRWIEHAGWVAFEDIFLILSCVQSRREMWQIAQRQAESEHTTALVETQVKERTAELRLREAELETARAAAEGASRAKSEFLANMSHEIRTPMTAILGFADMLLEPEQGPSERLNHIQVIRRNGQHLLTVINDILDISKIEAGEMTVERIACCPPELMAGVASLMGARATEKKLVLRIEYASPIPRAILSDPTRVRQILLNLVGNAIKFTESGTIRIVAKLVGTRVEPALEFQVIDSGVGMTQEQMARLFKPFSQGDSSMARRFGGTGLGLMISKKLTEMLGGTIGVTSTPGVGTTITVTIATGPLTGIPLVEGPAAGEYLSQPQSPSTQTRPLENIRLLLAEDGIDNQRFICHILRMAGADVTVVENGLLACDAALRSVENGSPFDCILMDMQMPELDGYAATSKLRSRHYRGVIIALTAHAMISEREKCLTAGCDDYATKPIDRKALINLITKYRGGHRAATAA